MAVAEINVRDYALQDRIALVRCDLFAGLGGRRYDLILANPPYVDAEAVAAFPPEYAAEPKLAHAGGADGLDVVRRILSEAGKHLTPNGVAGCRDRPRAQAAGARVSQLAVSVAGYRGKRG